MMGRSSKCYKPSLIEIGPSVPEMIFEGFFIIYGRVGLLGHVTSIMSSDFISLYLKAFIQIGLPVLEKIFEGFLSYMGVAAILVM